MLTPPRLDRPIRRDATSQPVRVSNPRWTSRPLDLQRPLERDHGGRFDRSALEPLSSARNPTDRDAASASRSMTTTRPITTTTRFHHRPSQGPTSEPEGDTRC